MPTSRDLVTAPPPSFLYRKGNAVAPRLSQKVVVGAVFVSAMFMNNLSSVATTTL
jgi:hypothetical protein